ncbi:MAG: hypothetical protein Q9217_000022 [Psora testacea]
MPNDDIDAEGDGKKRQRNALAVGARGHQTIVIWMVMLTYSAQCGRCRQRKIKCEDDMGDGRGCRACRNAHFNKCHYLRVNSGEVHQIEMPSPTYSDPSTQWGLSAPSTGERSSSMAPMRSDPSQYSISNIGQSHQALVNPYQRPTNSGLFSDSSHVSYQMRRPPLGPIPSNRASFDQANMHQQATMNSSRYTASGFSGRASSPAWNVQSTTGGFTGDTSTFSSEGFTPYVPSAILQTTSSDDYGTSLPTNGSSYFPGMSPMARQLPQRSNSGAGSRGSFSSSQGQYHPAAGLQSRYSNENYDLERVLSDTSQGSVASASQGAASTTSSSPKDSGSTSFGYTSISQSPSEMVNANLVDYNVTATTIDPASTLLSTSAAAGIRAHAGGHGQMTTLNSYHDYLGGKLNGHRPGGARVESTNGDYSSYRMLQPQQSYRSTSRTTTHERR